jgi:hypothetical protein
MSVTFYYHGGVPNKKPGDNILPAAALGLNYTWAYRNIPGVRLPDESQTKYRPDFAYFTTPRRVTGTSNRDSLKWLAYRIRCTSLAMRATRNSEASTPNTGRKDSAMTTVSKLFHRPIRKRRAPAWRSRTSSSNTKNAKIELCSISKNGNQNKINPGRRPPSGRRRVKFVR